MNNQLPEGVPVLYRWLTPKTDAEKLRRGRETEGWADEYAILDRPDLPSGIIIYGYYENRNEWVCNPSGLRPLVAHLLIYEQISRLDS